MSGGGRRGEHEARGRDADAHRVARVEGAVLVQHRDVVARVAGAREALQPEHDVSDDVDVLGRDGHELAPERVERVAVEPPGARLEPARLDEMRRADRRRRAPAATGCSRTRAPAAPAWSKWMWERSRCRTSPSSSPRAARPASRAGMHGVGPQSKSADAVVGLDEVAADVVREAAVQEVDRVPVASRAMNVSDRGGRQC